MTPVPGTEAARDLLAIIRPKLEALTSDTSQLRRHVAAAGLAKCHALLDGVCLLYEAGRTDVMGALNRLLCEVWIVSLYVLLQGDRDDTSVLAEIDADYLHWHEKALKRLGMKPEVRRDLETWREVVQEPKPLNYAAMAEKVGQLLAKTEGLPTSPLDIYDRMYRGESLYCAHANRGSFDPYIAFDQEGACHRIRISPGARSPGTQLAAAALTGHLALYLFPEFGLGTADVAAVQNRIHQQIAEIGSS